MSARRKALCFFWSFHLEPKGSRPIQLVTSLGSLTLRIIMKQELRQKLRQARNSLSPQQQTKAAQSLLQLFRESSFSESKRIALYIGADGEIDPEAICSFLWEQGSEVFLQNSTKTKWGSHPIALTAISAPTTTEFPSPKEHYLSAQGFWI